MQTLPMTAAGFATLQEELRQRVHVERSQIVARLQQAMSDDTNLGENAEYQAVVAEQAVNESRIADLEAKLAHAEVINLAQQTGDVIRFGATVTLIDEDTKAKKTWQIVGEPEADAAHGRISVTSPIARALIGKNRGESVEVHAPAGTRSYTIKNVQWPDELRGSLS